MDQKQRQSKSQYGTLTAKYDANKDYSNASGSKGSAATTSQSRSEYGTLTAKFDANNDYGGSKQKSSGSKQGQQQTQQQGKKVVTADKNVGE